MDSSDFGFANGNAKCGGLTSIVFTFSSQAKNSSAGAYIDVDDSGYRGVYRVFREGKGRKADRMVYVHRSRMASVIPRFPCG